jgi:hypothetical protein
MLFEFGYPADLLQGTRGPWTHGNAHCGHLCSGAFCFCVLVEYYITFPVTHFIGVIYLAY